MSASNTARSNVASIESSRRKLNFQLVDSGLAFIPLLVAVIGVGFGVVIAFNFGEWSPSFWLGLLALVALAIIVYTMWWASHPKTKTWPGFIIGLVDMVVLVALIALISTFANSFAWGQFLWGLLVAVLLAVVYVSIKLYGWLILKAAPKAAFNR